MNKYYINPDPTHNPHHNNEVHKEGCYWMPKHPTYLGEFENCIDAVEYAKTNGWPIADGCKTCCPQSNTDK